MTDRGTELQPSRAEFLRRGGVVLAGALAQLAATGCTNRQASRPPDDLDEMRKADPDLVKYREAGRIDTGFQVARGIAVSQDGSIYMAGDDRISVHTTSATVASFPVNGAPQCLAVAPDGAMYVGLTDHVVVLDSTGKQTAEWPSFGERAILTSIAVDGDAVWVADAGDRVVYRCDKAGKVLLSIGKKGEPKDYPGLQVPSPHLDVAIAKDGTVHITNPGLHRVEAYTPEGKLSGSWGIEGNDTGQFCGCCNPTDIAMMPDGRFVTTEKGLPRVTVFTAAGKLESVVASAETFADDAAGLDVAVDPTGRVLVLDPKTKAVRIYARII